MGGTSQSKCRKEYPSLCRECPKCSCEISVFSASNEWENAINVGKTDSNIIVDGKVKPDSWVRLLHFSIITPKDGGKPSYDTYNYRAQLKDYVFSGANGRFIEYRPDLDVFEAMSQGKTTTYEPKPCNEFLTVDGNVPILP